MAKTVKCGNCGESVVVERAGSSVKGFIVGIVFSVIGYTIISSTTSLTPEQQAEYEVLITSTEKALESGDLETAEKSLLAAKELLASPKTNELDDRYEEARLLVIARAIPASDFQGNIDAYRKLSALNPSNDEYRKKLEFYRQRKAADAAAKLAEKKRLAKLNSTGSWRNTFYVDEFGEPTKEPYIRFAANNGQFSNTATENSRLNSTFLIDSEKEIALKLYEYDGNNPVKSYGTERYRVSVQDKDGNRHQMEAVNYSDRLQFSEKHSLILHQVFLKGGAIKLRLYEARNPVNEYSINMLDADGYGNAYRKHKDAIKAAK